MKLIGSDNHARETVSDVLVAEKVVREGIAQAMCDRMNARLGDGPGTFYRLVADDYRLSRGMEDLV
jgi:hypothetical protein